MKKTSIHDLKLQCIGARSMGKTTVLGICTQALKDAGYKVSKLKLGGNWEVEEVVVRRKI